MTNLSDSLLEARKRMDMPPMNGVGHAGKGGSREYRYATLQDVLKCVMPPLMEQGVLLTQGFNDGTLNTVAWKGDESILLDSRTVNMTGTSQEQGSAETYAKRYALCSVFCIAGMEDDDGQAASSAKQQGVPENDVLKVAWGRVKTAVWEWCQRHGCDTQDEYQAKINGIQSRPEWEEQKGSLDYLNSLVREFQDA